MSIKRPERNLLEDPNTIQGGAPEASAPPPVIQAEVLVYVDDKCIAKYSITHGEYTVGRDVGCQLRLDVDGVSRHHARLAFQGYELILEDLGSANGVFIEGVQICLPTRVRPDQRVEIGSARLFIRLKAEASEMLAAALWDPDLGLAPVRAMLNGKKYKVQGTIGGGGMGIVHHARDLRIRRAVAMKVIKSSARFSRENVLRFVDEAQLTGQLQHPNIVPVYELGIDEHEEVFYTMKFVKGTTLDQVLREIRKGNEEVIQKYPLAALLSVFQKICDAIAYAHSMGVVHRDLKPDNVMIGEYGEVLVMDWGLAKKIAHGSDDEPPKDAPKEVPVPDQRGFQTLNGLIVGTPPYIAPEAARGDLDQIDPRSDIYVLGAILYAILTLRPPYPGKEFAELIEQIVSGKFAHPSSFNQPTKSSRKTQPPKPDEDDQFYILAHLPNKRVPEGLAAVVVKAMAYETAERYQNVAELQADITAWQGGFAPKAERAGIGRKFYLWASRHKGYFGLASAFAILFQTAFIWFLFSIKHERDRLRASDAQLHEAMQDLQGAAPLFAEEAIQLARREEYDAALDRVDSAIRQVPNNADYHNLRGNLLQVLLRWDDSIEAYENAVERNPNLASAKENLAIMRKLVDEMGDDPAPTPARIRELQMRISAQGRVKDAEVLLKKAGLDRSAALVALRLTIENDPSLMPLRDFVRRRELRGCFSPNADGTYTANFQKLPYPTVAPIFTVVPVQISALILDDVNIPDLTPLAGMRLRTLSLAGCRMIKDLAPLQKVPDLRRLSLARTQISDLTPLAGMPLVELNLEDCSKITDFHPLLKCTQLERLILPKDARDIGYLRALKSLKVLSYRSSNQSPAEFWADFDKRK